MHDNNLTRGEGEEAHGSETHISLIDFSCDFMLLQFLWVYYCILMGWLVIGKFLKWVGECVWRGAKLSGCVRRLGLQMG